MFARLKEAQVAIGREEEPMSIMDVIGGRWLKKGKSGIIKIKYNNKLISVSFSPEGGTYDGIPFEKIIDIS